MLNQFGADQTIAAGNFSVSGGVLTTKAAYNSAVTRLPSGENVFYVITIDQPGQGSAVGINASVTRNTAALQVSMLDSAISEIDVDYGSSPTGIGIGLGLAPNQIVIGFLNNGDFYGNPVVASYRVLYCYDGVNNS
jgi:hypothetical protein